LVRSVGFAVSTFASAEDFITAHEDEGMRAQALRDGAKAVLIKPFSEEALLTAIHTALSPR